METFIKSNRLPQKILPSHTTSGKLTGKEKLLRMDQSSYLQWKKAT